MDENKAEKGLSNGNISYITGIVFAVLLLYGPFLFDSLLFRLGYLILVPLALWYGLRFFGKKWDLDKIDNDRISRAISGLLAGVLVVLAVLSLNQRYHSECTQEVQTRDGSECVGDYVTVKGPDKGGAFIELLFAGFAIWHAVAKRPKNQE